jgi:hypothetical protein
VLIPRRLRASGKDRFRDNSALLFLGGTSKMDLRFVDRNGVIGTVKSPVPLIIHSSIVLGEIFTRASNKDATSWSRKFEPTYSASDVAPNCARRRLPNSLPGRKPGEARDSVPKSFRHGGRERSHGRCRRGGFILAANNRVRELPVGQHSEAKRRRVEVASFRP